MELSQSFAFDPWTVRYGVLPPSANSIPTDPPSQTDVPTILFVHGTPWSSAVFVPLARALAATGKYRIVLYDLPGYGQSQDTSSPSTSDTSVAMQAAALAALLSHLRIPPPHVIAHDIAGSIALRAHLMHGTPMASLLLMDTNCVLPWGDGFYRLAREHAPVFRDLPGHIGEAVIRSVVRSASVRLSAEWEEKLVSPWIGAQSSFVRQVAQANDRDVKEMLDGELYQKLQIPLRMLWGERDGWIPKAKLEQLAGMLSAEFFHGIIEIPGAGHLIMVDQPERVSLSVWEWLDLQGALSRK